MPFVNLGLVPEAASSLLLPRLVGHQRAAELLFLGKPLDAAGAHTLGLVSRVVEEATLLPEARGLARTLAQKPQTALLATRRLLRSDSGEIRARIDAEARLFGEQLRSEEFREAVRAVLTRARPGS
jgi:enoyl-CoA hydratase/carnithine racemase